MNHAFPAGWFRSVFAGKLTLPTNGKLAASVFSVGAADSAALTSVGGVYESGWRIVPLSDQSAEITKAGDPVGELRSMQDGYIAVFDDDADTISTAIRADDGELYWSDKTRWRRSNLS